MGHQRDLGELKQTVGREDTANGFRRGGSGRGRDRPSKTSITTRVSPVREETNTRNGEHHPLSSNAAMEPTPSPTVASAANSKRGPGRPRKVPDASVPTVVRGANTRRVRVRGGRGGGLSKSPDASVQPPSVHFVVRGTRRVRVRGGRGGGHAKLPSSPQQFNKDIPLENTAKRQRLELGPVSKTFNTCSSIIINKLIFTLSVIQFLCSSVDYTKCGSVR